MDKLEYGKIKFVKLSDKNIGDLTNFTCCNEEEEFEGFKSRQRKKIRRYSREIDEF